MKFYQSWEGRSCHPERNAWFTATVPGNIQKDYAAAKNWGDIHYGDNCLKYSEIEDDTWLYTA